MYIKKTICGLLLAFGLILFDYGQQDNQSPECLNQANDYKHSVFILIDPGHGCASNNGLTCLPGGQPGAVDDPNNVTYSEACMTTDLAIRLRDILHGLGLDVGMTRDTNIVQYPDAKAQEIQEQILSKRNEKGDNLKPYFISIHFNGGSFTANGNFGIYEHSNVAGESVSNIVSNAQNTSYLDENNLPIINSYPIVTLQDNQNNLFDALQRNIRFVLSGTYGTNTILYDSDGNDDCPARPSYKSLGIYRLGLFPLLSGWYAQSYNSCAPDHFSGNFTLVELPNNESIPVKHSLQEVEFISSPSFLRYLKRRQFVAIAMAWAITEDVVNDYINENGNASCIRGSMYNIDSCDDNNSSSSGINSGLTHLSYNSPILMPIEFINREIIGLLNGIGVPPSVTFKEFSQEMVKAHPILIIPTGLLIQYENDSIFKINLEQYVKYGGTIIVFAQQYGSHIDNVVPIPQGESLKSYGWREDQSCWAWSFNLKAMHPTLAGMAVGSIKTDGQFPIYPSDSTILLRKGSNQEPVLLYYPYGNGTVILTSMYTDWGAAHSQATASELRMVRDLVTFAKKPNLAIPMYDLTANPTPEISLQVKIKNETDYAVANAKMIVYTPDRKIALYQSESAVSLTTDQETEIAINFTLPELSDTNLGICHTDYELYDSENNLVQMATEADSGRFTPYRLKLSQLPVKDLDCWLTTNNESVYWDENPHFALHLRNNTDHEITQAFEYDWWHGTRTYLTSMTIPASQTQEYGFEVPLLANIHNWPHVMESFLLYKKNLYPIIAVKGIRVVYPRFTNKIITPSPQIRFGDAIGFSINATNTTGKAIPGEMTVKLFDGNNEIQTLFSQAHDFGKDETFTYSGSQALVSPIEPKIYTLQFGIKRPDGKTQYSYTYFYYARSNVGLNLSTIPEAYQIGSIYSKRFGLIPGNTYTVNFKLGNGSKFAINQGRYVVTLKSEDGTEVFRKEAINIAINASQWLSFSEPFVFSPTRGGKFTLKVEYTDESRTPELMTVAEGKYEYLLRAELTSSKKRYCYLDTANMQLKIGAVGRVHIKFTDGETGEVQEKDIDIPVGQPASELYQVPVTRWMSSFYNVFAVVTDSFGNNVTEGAEFLTTKPIIEHSSRTDILGLKEDLPLNLTLALTEKSGMTVPCPGILTVTATGLNFSETRNVTLQPVIANEFAFQIPIAESVAAGTHQIAYKLEINGQVIAQGSARTSMPAITLNFSEPPVAVNDSDPFDLRVSNSGGRSGAFALTFNLKDETGREVLAHEEPVVLAPAEAKTVSLRIPVGVKSGKYILMQKAVHTASGLSFELSSGMTVSGLTATLNTYTLQEKYFDFENVVGKAEITAGTREIADATLKARINRIVGHTGDIEVQKPTELPNIEFTRADSANNKLFVLVRKNYSQLSLFTIDLASGAQTEEDAPELMQLNGYSGLFCTSDGEVWIPGGDSVLRKDSSGIWTHYSQSAGNTGGLDLVYFSDMLEYEDASGKTLWFAGINGVFCFKDGAWSQISDKYSYKLAVDQENKIWLSTRYKGLYKYEGGQFIAMTSPFEANAVQDAMTSTTDGTLWFNIRKTATLYKYRAGQWETIPYADILPDSGYSVWLYNLRAIENDVWFQASISKTNDYRNAMVKYDGEFHLYKDSYLDDMRTANTWYGDVIVDHPAGGVFVLTDNLNGNDALIEFKDNRWIKRKVFSNESLTLWAGDLGSVARDGQGRLWLGTEEGLTSYDGQHYQSFRQAADGCYLEDIMAIDFDTAGRLYALFDRGVAVKEGLVINWIPFPNELDLRYGLDERSFCRDSTGRVWVTHPSIGSLYYYAANAWSRFAAGSLINQLCADGRGGVWAAGVKNDDSCILMHIQPDLTISEYHAGNSPLTGGVDAIYVNAQGKLWVSGWADSPELWSFDGTEWVAHSGKEGFPYPIIGISEDGRGNMVFAVGSSGELGIQPQAKTVLTASAMRASFISFFSLEGETFVDWGVSYYSDNLSLLADNGKMMAIGDTQTPVMPGVARVNQLASIDDYYSNYFLLRITKGANSVEQEVWSRDYPVSITASEDLAVDIDTQQAFAAGNYVLRASLESPLQQELAEASDVFVVRGSAVSASLALAGTTDFHLRAGADQELNLEVLNNTAEDKPALALKVIKISPTGIETLLQDGAIALNAGQSHAGILTFNESENGIWKLVVTVTEAEMVLDSVELALSVNDPLITYEITVPPYAGNEAFPVKVNLTNPGKIPASVHVQVLAYLSEEDETGIPKIEEDVLLLPGEARILSFTDAITSYGDYEFSFSGDLEAAEWRGVSYGYVGSLDLNVLPQYREGTVSMGFTIANGGGLPFSDTIHFELFAVGNAVPIYTADKTYNLYPDAEASADALEFPLAPGAFQLRWTSSHSGSGQNNFSVLPAGIGQLAFAPAPKYPVGLTEFAYALSNSDTVAGSIDLLIEIVPAAGGAAVYSLNRSHYLEPGANVSDTFSCDFAGNGSYIVRVSGAKVSGGTVSVPVKVLNLDEVTTSVAVQPTSDGIIPVQVQVANNGFNDFAGTLVIEAGGLRHEEPLAVLSETILNQAYGFDANGLSSGSHEVLAFIYDAAGNVLSQNTLTVAVANADIKVSEVPQNLTIAAGAFANVTLKVRNEGNKRGEAEISLTAFDNLNETRTLALEAGEELELSELFIDVDADIPAGRYPLNYVLSGSGVANGLAKGNFTFQVTGIALDVAAALDRSLYNQGETAQLTIDVSSVNPVTAPLEAVVNWNDFSERRPFTLDSGSSSLVFEIPLAEASDAKVFYGIYQQEGRGIYLNDIYLNFAGGVSVTLDQQVYAPGDSIHALFAVSEAGSLTAECFGQSQTIAIGASGSINFAVPAAALGGSYGISWTFTPTDASHETLSGAKPFDVSGLVVKVAKAELERGKYAPGDIIKAMLNLESNRDITLSLRSWTVTPEAAWTYLGEQNVSLSATQQVPAVLQYAFATSEAGTHRFVYGLYNGEQLVVSGAAAFDCGDAVLIGLACDRLEYPLGSETVKVRIDHFGSGTATLQLYLDDVPVETRSITLMGLGSTQIDLAAAQVGGGRHDLRAVISKDGLTSTRRAWFTYGTSLPDLAVGIGERAVNGLDYVFNVQVFNSGKTASPATALVFSDNGTDMQSAAIGGLAPGAWQDAQFTWSGSGKAGSHALTFTVDRDNVVKEFAEGNNVLQLSEEVPSLFYSLSVDPPVWTANSTVSIFSHFINNQAGELPLSLHLTLTHNLSSQVVLARDKDVTLTPFVQTLETDLFQTGIYPAGDYTLAQTASGGSVERTEELAVYIERTKAISGTMSAVPATVAAGIDAQVTLKLALSNIGNIALDNETLSIEVAGKESQQVVKTETLSVALAIGENKAIDHILALNLAEGIYAVTLKFSGETIAETEIVASMGMEKEKIVSRRPRLLFMNTQTVTFNSQKNFLKAVLNAAGIQYQDSGNLIESYFHDQKSEHNINVVFGKLATQSLKNELKERIHRGEGLIHIVDNPASDAVMEELSGVKAHNLLPALREKEITLLPGVLGGGGTALLKDKCKLGLEMLADDVLVVAETRNGKKPLAAYRPYGNGKVLTISLPLEFTSGGGFAQLLLNAVQLLNNDVFSPSDLARVLPLELRIKNNTGAAKTFRVQELIPQAAAGYGFNPQPLEGDGVKWDIQLAVDEEKTVSYWLRLPDAIGIFDVKSEIFEGAQKVDEALLTFEVGQKIADRAAGIAAEIAAGGDDQTKKALQMLQRIAGRSSEDPVSLWLNLVDAVRAADLVAASATAEAMAWRRGLQDLLMACARMFYDKVKDFTLLELNAFGTRFAE